ncbi:MAG: sugar transferase [Methylocystis sp.]|uniref:sugar transferase n=1 Tax=Methylocystis sp. TaxID=1911079 RepID=UPI00394461DE
MSNSEKNKSEFDPVVARRTLLRNVLAMGAVAATAVIAKLTPATAQVRLPPVRGDGDGQSFLKGVNPQALVCALFVRPLHTTKNSPNYRVVKRVLDLAIATLGVVACAPLFILTSLLIFVSMGSPIIVSERRVGRGGRTINVYKFKTRRNPVDSEGRQLSLRERSTHVGRALRARRLDELPLLFSVIKGDMAIVGPRLLPTVDQPAEPSLRLAARAFG